MHIHVRSGRDNAKFWLYPDVSVAYQKGFSPRVQSELIVVIAARRQDIEDAWNDHFS